MDMNKIGTAIKGLIVAGAFVATGSVMAASTTGLGPTSTGTVDITVDVGDQILIDGLVDITGSYVPGSDFVGTSPACVYKNGGNGNFGVTATSQTGGGSFLLTDAGSGTSVTYAVNFTDGSVSAPLLHGTPVITFTNANTVSTTCGGTPQSTVTVTVAETGNLDSAIPGAYFDTLQLVVAPQ